MKYFSLLLSLVLACVCFVSAAHDTGIGQIIWIVGGVIWTLNTALDGVAILLKERGL